MREQVILLVGEVFVDTHLDLIDVNGPLVRLGGIFHAARACSSVNTKFALAYYAPDYLDDDINNYSCFLNSKACYKLGSIDKAPNVMLVNESREIGDQGYYNILKDQAVFIDTTEISTVIDRVSPTDIIIYPGRYNTNTILSKLLGYQGNIHIDLHYDSDGLLDNITNEINTVILSTSSDIFSKRCNGTWDGIKNYFKRINLKYILLKENRGGSSCISLSTDDFFEAPAYYVPTMHSVGVGDVYNIFLYGIKGAIFQKK